MRSMLRNQAKSQYSEFCRAWAQEKREQMKVLARDGKLPPGIVKLGKKPPFSVWLKRVNALRASGGLEQLEQPKVEEVRDEAIDLEWKDE